MAEPWGLYAKWNKSVTKDEYSMIPLTRGTCCCSVAKSCPTSCHLMDCSMPGFLVPYHLLKFVQFHVHWISDAIQLSHPLSSPPPAFNLSQHQGLFKWISSSASGGQRIGVSASTSVLPINTQDWSPLGWTAWISLQSKGLSRVFSNTTVQKHRFFGT